MQKMKINCMDLHHCIPSPHPMLLLHFHPANHKNNNFISTHIRQGNCTQILSSYRSERLRAKRQQCNVARDGSAISTMGQKQPAVSAENQELIMEVKGQLEREYRNLSTGINGRDDEEMILWFLKDRKFSVDDAVRKLAKAIAWRQTFGVDNLTEESIQNVVTTGKAYLHEFPDVKGRPVVVVVAAKHLPAKHDLLESKKLCIYLIEKALKQLSPGEEKLLGIFDLRGFTVQNGDLAFIKFLIDVFYDYYPKRIGQVLFVDAPFIFQPCWNLVKPWLKSYANLLKHQIDIMDQSVQLALPIILKARVARKSVVQISGMSIGKTVVQVTRKGTSLPIVIILFCWCANSLGTLSSS